MAKSQGPLGSLAIIIFTAVVGGITVYLFDRYKDDVDRTPRFIDYEVVSSSVFPPGPCIPGKNVSITIDGTDVASATRLDVSVYNFSDKDFRNVRFYIALIPATPAANLKELILAESACGVNCIPEIITRLNVEPSDRPGVERFGYEVTSLNRSYSFMPSFKASYFLVGGAIPTVDIKTDNAEVDLRMLSKEEHPLQANWWTRILHKRALLFSALVLLIVALVAGSRFLASQRKSRHTAG